MIDIKLTMDARAALSQLDRIASAGQRSTVIADAVSEALAPIVSSAQSIVQQPGKEGYTPRHGARRRKKKLRDTITQRMRIYQNTIIGIVGPSWPRGAHGHLVERGHRMSRGGALPKLQRAGWTPELVWHSHLKTLVYKHGAPRRHKPGTKIGKHVGYVQPRPFLRPAAEQHMPAAQVRLLEALQRHIANAVGAGNG